MSLVGGRSSVPRARIGSRVVGADAPCYVIAEAGANHNRNFDLARRLIDAAANAGADAVKFQTYSGSTLYSKKTPRFEYLGELGAKPAHEPTKGGGAVAEVAITFRLDEFLGHVQVDADRVGLERVDEFLLGEEAAGIAVPRREHERLARIRQGVVGQRVAREREEEEPGARSRDARGFGDRGAELVAGAREVPDAVRDDEVGAGVAQEIGRASCRERV